MTNNPLTQKIYTEPTQILTLKVESDYLNTLKVIQHANFRCESNIEEICEQTLLVGAIFCATRGKYLIEVFKIPEDNN